MKAHRNTIFNLINIIQNTSFMKHKALFIGLFIFSFSLAIQAQTNSKQTKKGATTAQVSNKKATIQRQQVKAKADGKITPKERIELKAREKKASKAVSRSGH